MKNSQYTESNKCQPNISWNEGYNVMMFNTYGRQAYAQMPKQKQMKLARADSKRMKPDTVPLLPNVQLICRQCFDSFS